MLISFVSGKSSPGVTAATLAVASRWPRTAVVIDADPFGGDLAAGLGRGDWPPSASLVELVVDARAAPVETVLRHRVHRSGPHTPWALAGFGSLGQAAGVPWDRITGDLAALSDADVLADCGRFASGDGVLPLLTASDVVVLVSGSSLRAARSTARTVRQLWDALGVEPGDPRLALLVVRPDEPYASREIAESCGLPLLGELPADGRAAAVWTEGAAPGRGFSRSALQREAAHVAVLLGSAARHDTGAAAR